MIWLALVMTLLALTAVVRVAPDRIPAKLLMIYFSPSLTVQLFALPLTLIAVVLAVVADGAARWVFVLAALLLALAHFRNRRAGRLLLDAVGQQAVRIPLLAGIAPPAVGDTRVRRIKGIAYGDAGARNLLDLIVPKQPPAAPMPILIHVHGGGWTMGDKNQQGKPLLNHLVPQGWLGVDVTYRLGPQDRFPSMVVDVLKAIAWVKAHAHEHGGDPARIALTGGSAGGHLTALAALAHDDPAFKPGFEDADCRVTMALPMYGRYDFLDRERTLGRNFEAIIEGFMAETCMPGAPNSCLELWHAVSPLDRIRPDAPPMLITHGTGDTMLPYQDARTFAAALRAASSAPVTYVELPGIQHAYDMGASALAWAHVRALAAFLAPLARAQREERRGEDLRGESGLADLAG